MSNKALTLFFIFGILIIFSSLPVAAQEEAEMPVVQAVLFYSPTCPHCHQIINEVLVPMQDALGDQLQILALSTQEEVGQQLYQAAVDFYEIPDSRLGVPTLIIDDTVLVGSVEAETQFPAMVEDGLANSGIGWPSLPALHLYFPDLPKSTVAANDETADPEIQAIEPAEGTADSTESPLAVTVEEVTEGTAIVPELDRVGMTIGWIVLLFMIVASGYVVSLFVRQRPNPNVVLTHWLIPVLSVVGLGIALYLSYVEVTQAEAVCGPVGECNVVQSSPYAQIAGIPVAVLGVINYVVIIALWFWQRNGRIAGRSLVMWLFVGITGLGTLFSIYLTGLELFVIHAVCVWCLSSAIATTILMVLVAVSVMRSTSPLAQEAFL